MAKRNMQKGEAGPSPFKRNERDFYPTPWAAVQPLLPHLTRGSGFIEPCAGDGALVRHLEEAGHVCFGAFDIEPQHPRVQRADALTTDWSEHVDCFITNPPFKWEVLHPLIEHLRTRQRTWLLLPWDMACNVRFAQHMDHCRAVVPVGRVKWIPDSPHSSAENFAWYCFMPGGQRDTTLYRRA